MDISALGTQFLDQAYVPFASTDLSMSSMPSMPGTSREASAFGELLKRTENSQAKAEFPSEGVRGKSPIDKNDKLYELCLELETFLIKNLIKSMRGTVQKTGLIDTGFAGEVYEDMLYDEYAKTFSKNANFGFAEMAYRDLAGY